MWGFEDTTKDGKLMSCMNRHEELSAEYGESDEGKGRKTKVLNNHMREREKGRSCSVGAERDPIQQDGGGPSNQGRVCWEESAALRRLATKPGWVPSCPNHCHTWRTN